MPGTSEIFEDKNFDGINTKWVEPIRLLLNHYPLEVMVQCLLEEVPESISCQFPLIREDEWRSLVAKVVFSKITTFELNSSSNPDDIHYLIALLTFCFNPDSKEPIYPRDLPNDYSVAQKWLNKAYAILRLKSHRIEV